MRCCLGNENKNEVWDGESNSLEKGADPGRRRQADGRESGLKRKEATSRSSKQPPKRISCDQFVDVD